MVNQFELTKLLAETAGWSTWKISSLAWQQGSLSKHTGLEVVCDILERSQRSASSSGHGGPDAAAAGPQAEPPEEAFDFSFFDASFLKPAHADAPKTKQTQIVESDLESLSDGCGDEDEFVDAEWPKSVDESSSVPKAKEVHAVEPDKVGRAAKTKSTDFELVARALGDRRLVGISAYHILDTSYSAV